MGCCSSSYKTNVTIDGLYGSPERRSSSKRSYSSRISTASSGFNSGCTTPTRRSLNSRCSAPSPRPKPNNINYQNCTKKDFLPKEFQMLSICDDFDEAAQMQQQQPLQQQHDSNNSYGYFTESISTGSTPSTPSKSSTRRTPDTSISANDDARTPSPCGGGDLEMEMYMMTHAKGLMTKTSSPMPLRRDIDATYDVPATPLRPSASYNKWRNYLQSTPAYMVHNVTHIPEAIAGHFCPADFPAFIELECDENVAKRFKADVPRVPASRIEVPVQVHVERPVHATQTISTDL